MWRVLAWLLLGQGFAAEMPATGAFLSGFDEDARPAVLRIDATAEEADRFGVLHLYRLSRLDAASKTWRPYCEPDGDEPQWALPLKGTWRRDGSHEVGTAAVTFACWSGAIAKCVRWGYRPWLETPTLPMRRLHEACVRMVRADYCGDGVPHTRKGVKLVIADRYGVQTPSTLALPRLEAAWDEHGALWLAAPRLPGLGADAAKAACPRLDPAPPWASWDESAARILGAMPQGLLVSGV